MCITQDTNIEMFWYDHYCANINTLTLCYLPYWSCIILYDCFYNVEVMRMKFCFTDVKRIYFNA